MPKHAGHKGKMPPKGMHKMDGHMMKDSDMGMMGGKAPKPKAKARRK